MRQFAVIGLGRFGSSVAKTLAEKGCQVLGVDITEAAVQDMSEILTQAVCIDARDEKSVRAIGVENVDVAVVAIGTNIEASILITLLLKEIGIKGIVCKAISEDHKKVLQRVGATRVIMPERDMGVRLANSLVSPKVIEHIDLGKDSSIVEIIPPKGFIGKTLRELDVRVKYGVNVIAIKRKIKVVDKSGGIQTEEQVDFSPEAENKVKEQDVLVVIGDNKKIDELKKIH